jgi:hypothetical protein
MTITHHRAQAPACKDEPLAFDQQDAGGFVILGFLKRRV